MAIIIQVDLFFLFEYNENEYTKTNKNWYKGDNETKPRAKPAKFI